MINNKISFEQQAYEIKDLWIDENFGQADKERIEVLFKKIPDDAKSILDAGCGNGIFINYLKKNSSRFERLCGMDRSSSALDHVEAEKCIGNIENLEFKNEEFDLVACLEVLEHLPIETYNLTLKEICRVSKKYVLITVPNNENFRQYFVTCPSCLTEFNPNHHMRSFTLKKMIPLLNKHEFSCQDIFLVNKENRLVFASKIQKFLSPEFPWFAICPVCGHKGSLSLPRKAQDQKRSFVFDFLKTTVKKVWPKRQTHTWICGLYKKNVV